MEWQLTLVVMPIDVKHGPCKSMNLKCLAGNLALFALDQI